MIATAREYADFLIAVSRGQILRKDTVVRMWTRQSLADGSLVPFSTLGWATGVRGTDRYVTHGGMQPGTTAVMHWFPEAGAGSVILCNAEGPALDALQEEILKVLLNPYFRR
ncbi:MAG TPA: serine hydrolase [Bryobacteraceae bacterium]|nr:serine hydrolase [Bryobacteraceae bacterium]